MSARPFDLWVADGAAERSAFAAAATAFLMRDEARHNLQLAVLADAVRGRYPSAHLVAARDATGGVTDVALRTPPHPLLVASGGDATSRAALLGWFLAHDPDLDRMVGPLPEVAEASAWWARHRGVTAHRRFHQGVYALHAVRPAVRAAGTMRLATEADRALAGAWFDAFTQEALHRADATGDALFASFVEDPVRRLYLWTTAAGEVVSMAGRSGRTPSGVRIGPVYTPPAHRGRGYGEALVAAVSQRELDEGARACYLYTDLDYGASNRLYLRIGYAQVGEAAEMGFEAPSG
jgi:GNAT superfamily N-acetyltransferase